MFSIEPAFTALSGVNFGFITPWRTMFEENDRQVFFDTFEKNLNSLSKRNGELKLTVPMLYIECVKK